MPASSSSSSSSSSSKMELKPSRSTRIYRPSEAVEGKLVVSLPSPISHHGIRITVSATVDLQIRAGMVGVVELLYNVVKPVTIVRKCRELVSPGKIGSGKTEIPFSVTLVSGENIGTFYETYHGSNISIQYLLTAEIIRGYLHKSLSTTLEFIVEADGAFLEPPVCYDMENFLITQETQNHLLLPELLTGNFQVKGKILTQCSLLEPLSGELTVETSAVPICSIDIQLLRVESVLVGDKVVTDTSVIQTTQIADGDVFRPMTLPIYVLLPRLLTCPTVLARPFSIEFQVSIVITFQSELSKLYPKSDLRTPRPWAISKRLKHGRNR